MATASGNMRDTASHDPFFMLPRGHMLVQQGFGRHHPNSQSSWDMAGGLHLPSLRHNSGYKQTQFTGNMNLSSSLLDSVGLNHNRPVGNITGPGKQNIPGHSSVPMHLPGGNLPARTLTEPPGAGFYRPRTVAKPKDGPGKRALQRPQTQPHHGTFAYLQAKEMSPGRSGTPKAGPCDGIHTLGGHELPPSRSGNLYSRGGLKPSSQNGLLPKVTGQARGNAPLRQRLGDSDANDLRGAAPSIYKLQVPSDHLAQFGASGFQRANSNGFENTYSSALRPPTPEKQAKGPLEVYREISPSPQTGALKCRGELFGRSTLDMGTGKFELPDRKVHAREHNAWRASHNAHAFLSPSRGGPRDVSPQQASKPSNARSSTELFDGIYGPVLGINLKRTKIPAPIGASGGRTRSRPMEASKKASKQQMSRREGGRSTVLALSSTSGMVMPHRQEPTGPLPSATPAAAHKMHGTETKVLKEHHHTGVPVGAPRTGSNASLPAQQTRASTSSMPAHSSPTNGRMSLSQLPLPWDGNAASVPVLKEPLAPINTQSPPVPSTAKEINEQPVSETAGATEDLGPEKLSAQNAAEPSAARVETEYLGKATRQEDKQTQGDSRRAHNETKKSLERVQENSSSSEPRQVPCDMEADADAFTETQADPIKPVAERSASMEAAATVKPVQDAPAVVEEEGMPLDEAPPPRYEPHMEAAALTVDDEEDYAMVEPDDLETSGPPESQMDDEVFSEVESEAGEYTELVIPVDEDMEEEVASRDNDEYDGGSWASNTRVLADKYEVLQVVGEGAYGLVMKCKVKGSGKHVAIKEFKLEDDDPDADDVRRTSKREVELLKELKHRHVVGFIEDFYVRDRLFIVMEFVPRNLLEVLESHDGGLDREMVRSVMFQLITAITFIHEKNIVYRDIKPENLLVTPTGQIKLCDFGFARHVSHPEETLTDYVATRWYRAPELLLGPPWKENGRMVPLPYGAGVDMWAIGCLMGELIDGEPLFAGDSDIDQLYKIQKIQGAVPSSLWEVFARNPNNTGIVFNVKDPLTLAKRYEGKLNDVELDFMEGLLALDPAKRLTGRSCLSHPYLQGLAGTYGAG